MDSKFEGESNFRSAKFKQEANFRKSEFKQKADFFKSEFKKVDFQEAQFEKAEFKGEVDIRHTQFEKANFRSVNFRQITNFESTEFKQKASFEESIFEEEVEFRSIEFSSENKGYIYEEQPLIDWSDLLEYPNEDKFDDVKQIELTLAGLDLPSDINKVDRKDDGSQIKFFSSNKHENDISLTLYKEQNLLRMNVIGTDNTKEFLAKKENNNTIKIYESKKVIPIQFDYCTFRKRVRFVGTPLVPLKLRGASFKGVDLTSAEFHNVKWQEEKGALINRKVITDEMLLDENKNYEELSYIYNQLRKNYETRLLFNEASHFFVGEMEAIRKSMLSKNTLRDKVSAIGYALYKWLALYGESISLPLLMWTPSIIVIFILLRYFLTGTCSLAVEDKLSAGSCEIWDHIVDSLAAYFQFPRSGAYYMDTIERIISIPILGTAFIAIRRRFERLK